MARRDPSQPTDPDQVPKRIGRKLRRRLVRGERVIAASRQHLASQAMPLLALVGALGLALHTDVVAPPTTIGRDAANGAWFVVTLAGLWCAWRLLNWWRDWFVATDKRFLLFRGLISEHVAMTPLAKVTDLTFDRSLMGRLLGYGAFRLESAGQDQALSRLDFLPDAEDVYRDVCTEMFGADWPDLDEADWADDMWHEAGGAADDGWGPPDDGWGPPDHPHGGPGTPSSPGDAAHPGTGGPGTSGEDRRESARHTGEPHNGDDAASWDAHDDPTRDGTGYGERHEDPLWMPAPPPPQEPETIYRSEDLVRARRLADTGELPVIVPRRIPPPRAPRRRDGRDPDDHLPPFIPDEWTH